MDTPFIIRLLASSVASTYRASEIVRQVTQSGSFETINKGIKDYQTKADRDSQKCIISSLEKNFPLLKIIGEEGNLTIDHESEICSELNPDVMKLSCPTSLLNIEEKDIVVWVDPLDGTNEFTQGLLSHVTILVGFALKGVPVGGIVCQPFYSNRSMEKAAALSVTNMCETSTRLIWGFEGLGIHGLRAQTPSTDLSFDRINENCNVLVTTRSHPSQIVNETLEACCASKILRVGGCGYKILQLLEGVAHAYVYASGGCKKWDTCAPEALLRIAGGDLTNIFGTHYSYGSDAPFPNNQGVLATAKAEWLKSYTDRIPPSLVDVLK